MIITGYEAICNLGNNINSIYSKAISGDVTCFSNLDGFIENSSVRLGLINAKLQNISDDNFNIRCNQLLKLNLELLKDKVKEILKNYKKDRIGIILATTNSGVEEFEKSKNRIHSELSNPAYFIRKELGLSGFYSTVSTACSSGLKAFILARDLINAKISDCAIVACVDSFAKVPLYGFNSLEVLSDEASIPFSSHRKGMNLAEGVSIFIIEKKAKKGIKIMGLGETSDIYHTTTPDPKAKEAIRAIKIALKEAKISSNEIDYINAHGTGTIANDIMETNAIYSLFPNTPVSSTKPMTGHCLGAGAGIETALCAKLIDNFEGKLYPHIYDNCYDNTLKKINLVKKDRIYNKCEIVMCNSFGFGGANAIIILGKYHEK